MRVAPVAVLAPDRFRVALPIFTRLPVPETGPESHSELAPSAFTTSRQPAAKSSALATPGAAVRGAQTSRFPAVTSVVVSSVRSGPLPSELMWSIATVGAIPLAGVSFTPPPNVFAPLSITPGDLPVPLMARPPGPATGPASQMSLFSFRFTKPVPRLNVLGIAPAALVPSKLVV